MSVRLWKIYILDSRVSGVTAAANQLQWCSISWHELVLVENQGNHKNLVKKNSRWPTQKTEFFKSANSQYFFLKILGIGSWFSRIN